MLNWKEKDHNKKPPDIRKHLKECMHQLAFTHQWEISWPLSYCQPRGSLTYIDQNIHSRTSGGVGWLIFLSAGQICPLLLFLFFFENSSKIIPFRKHSSFNDIFYDLFVVVDSINIRGRGVERNFIFPFYWLQIPPTITAIIGSTLTGNE